MDDSNAERAIVDVLSDTYYEGRIRVINIWDGIEYMASQ